MANKKGDSKVAVVGTITLGLAIAGVLWVQEPLKSVRPAFTGTEKPPIVEGLAPARLWEDPLEAVRRTAKSDGETIRGLGDARDDVDRVRAVRRDIQEKIAEAPDRPVTVLLVLTEGGTSGESRETRIRDRYAIGSALGVSCYVPSKDDQLSYLEWRDAAGTTRVLPYEWYVEGPRKCAVEKSWAPSVLLMWISSEVVGDHTIGTLQKLTQAILCEESAIGRHACQSAPDGTVLLMPKMEQHVRFKIIGPRSSSAFRSMLEEATRALQGREDHLLWANAGGRVELYSPWATAIPRLLTQDLAISPKPAGSTECQAADPNAERLCWVLLRAGIEIKHRIGSDDDLFRALTDELERRRVVFEKKAVVLIAEWDSFYGRVLPVEFTAAVCHRIAHRSAEDNRTIDAERLARIQSSCGTYDDAVDLQVKSSVGTRGLGLNVWRYSYLRGLDGNAQGEEKTDTGKASPAKAGKSLLLDTRQLERPVGTSQFDYTQRLADRIERDMQEIANAASDNPDDQKNPVAAIGILGSDAYDALLIMQALRDRFPGAVFFTTDLDTRLIYAEEYHWTRNLVIASHFGLELFRMLQRDVPPFRSSYQTSVYLATLRAVGQVQALSTCPPEDRIGPGDFHAAILSPCGYQANLTGDHVWFSATEAPRLYEVGRRGAVDLTVDASDQGYTLHPARMDLSDEDPQTNGRRPPSGAIYGGLGLAYLVVVVLLWTKPRSNAWMTAHRGLLLTGLGATLATAFVVDRYVLDVVLQRHDQGEPFYWFEGVSVWPTELLRAVAVLLAAVFFFKALRDLRANVDTITARYGFAATAELPGDDTGWRRYLATVHWVMAPSGGRSESHIGTLWDRYREAGSGWHRLPRILLLSGLYAAAFVLLWKVLGAEDFSGPCRGPFSCQVDGVLMLISYLAAAVLNLFVFDAVLLCRRWIGNVAKATEGWPRSVAAHLSLQAESSVAKAQELMKIELIANRTEVVNRLVRYPFIVLLIMMVARNQYFDNWHFPLTMVVGWSVNVALALAAALLLYRAAERARTAGVNRLNRLVLQGLDKGASGEHEVRLTRQVIENIESVSQGAFVPLWQQPVIESSFYGGLALIQYLYLS